MSENIVLTGDRPTGPLHLGHYAGSLLNRLKLQKQYKFFLMVADVQALTDNFENPKKIKDNIFEIVKDYIASGIDSTNVTIFLQSQIPAIAELTVFFLNLITKGKLEGNPTIKTEIKQKGYETSVPMGFFCYPVSQAADIAIFRANLVPVGQDQLPMIEQANEIIEKFNKIYTTDFLRRIEYIAGDVIRLPGIDGKNKMSKSLKNAIFLKDSDEEIVKKVMQCYTDPNHINISDPGQVEGNVVFTYLDAFCSQKNEVEELKEKYKAGGLGDVTLKKKLIDVLIDLIAPIRQKRAQITDEYVIQVLKDGCIKANEVAENNIKKIKEILMLGF